MILVGNWQRLAPPGRLCNMFVPAIGKNMRHLSDIDTLDATGCHVGYIA
jgi:hypothetical protein